MTTGREAFEATLSRGDWDLLQPDTRLAWEHRARGERPFIPAKSSARVNEAEPEQRLPIPPPEVERRTAEPDEIPRGPKTIVNLARKEGWEVWVTYARGPWQHASGELAGLVESLAVRCRRGEQRVTGLWLHKMWLSDPGYEFDGARAKPRVGDTYLHDANGLKAILRSDA